MAYFDPDTFTMTIEMDGRRKISVIGVDGGGHSLLGPGHTDTVTQTVSRGSLIYGNSTPAWDELTVGAAGSLLRSDGTDVSWSVNLKAAGWGRVGSTSDPTNTTAGDFTATRVFAGNVAAAVTGSVLQVASTIPSNTGSAQASAWIATTTTPTVGTDADSGLRILNTITLNQADTSAIHNGIYVTVIHSAGANDGFTHNGVRIELTKSIGGTQSVLNGVYSLVTTNAGTTTLSRASLFSVVQATAGTTTTGVAVDILNSRTAGTFTTSIGLRIQAATGTIGTNIALQSLGGHHRFVGDVKIGADSTPGGPLDVAGTVTSASTNAYIASVQGLLNGAGAAPIGVLMSNALAPSTSIAAAYGVVASAQFTHGGGVTITGAYGLQSRLLFNFAGAITTAATQFINTPLLTAGTPTTMNGLLVENQGLSGVTTSYGVHIMAQSGSTTNVAFYSAGGENRIVGNTVIGANQTPTLGLVLAGSARFQHTASATLTATLDSMFYLSGTVTNNTGAVINGMHLGQTFNGSGDLPAQLVVRPFFAPSSSITEAYGGSLAAIHGGGTITGDLIGFRPVVASFSNTGSVARFIGVRADGPAYTGSVRATTAIGILIANQGVASQTNAIGLHIDAQSGSTNNYDMSFGRVDTTAAGAYYGRIPVLYNGLTKYVHVFSA